MTRINLIKVDKLSDQHLLAELRELPRIFSHVKKHGVQKSKIPDFFTLGKGHVLFFTDKLKFLRDRYVKLFDEYTERGFVFNYSMQMLECNYGDLFDKQQIDWSPSEHEIDISQQRIDFKISMKPNWYRFTSKA